MTLNGKHSENTGNWIQQLFAVSFLVMYAVLTGAMFVMLFKLSTSDFELPDWSISLISTIWGGMSTKISTITDYFFGSSQGSRDKDEKLKVKE